VRAAMVGDAAAWPWNSYRAMVDLAVAPAWLDTDWVLGQFEADRRTAQVRYAAFVAAGMGRPSGAPAIKSFSVARHPSSTSRKETDRRNGCVKSPGHSVAPSPNRCATTSRLTPSAAQPCHALSALAFIPYRNCRSFPRALRHGQPSGALALDLRKQEGMIARPAPELHAFCRARPRMRSGGTSSLGTSICSRACVMPPKLKRAEPRALAYGPLKKHPLRPGRAETSGLDGSR
jgi:hypothetical protein